MSPDFASTFIALGGIGIGIAGSTFMLALRIERRLTRIETTLKLDSK